jgi:hypothetical protein
MFDMAHELGSLLNIRNRLGLTPLTLAAKLARRDMFFHILKIQREVYWQLGKDYITRTTNRTLTVQNKQKKTLGLFFFSR